MPCAGAMSLVCVGPQLKSHITIIHRYVHVLHATHTTHQHTNNGWNTVPQTHICTPMLVCVFTHTTVHCYTCVVVVMMRVVGVCLGTYALICGVVGFACVV